MKHQLREYNIIKTDFIESCFCEKTEEVVSWRTLLIYMTGVLIIGAVIGGAVISYVQWLNQL